MLANHVKERLRADRPAVGVWCTIGDPLVVEFLAAQGWHWLCVDTEHNPIDLHTMTTMFQAIGRYPCAPLARVPEISEMAIKRVLDAGAWGVVAPNVKTAAEAQVLADFAQYPPRGKRSIGSGRYPLAFKTDVPGYLAAADEAILRVVQIEHVQGVEHVDAILAVPGIDACFIGPNDLCASMGLTPSLEPPHPEFHAAIRTILEAARRHGVAPGIHNARPETASHRIAEGWRLVGCGSDMAYLTGAARAARDLLETDRDRSGGLDPERDR